MSLINKMLQDLDARRAGDAGAVPVEVRALPVSVTPPSGRQRLLVIAAVTLALAVAAWWGMAHWGVLAPEALPMPSMAKLSPSPAVPPAPDDAPARPEQTVTMPEAATSAAEVTPEPAAPTRKSRMLSVRPGPAAASRPAPSAATQVLAGDAGLRLSHTLALGALPGANMPPPAAPAPHATGEGKVEKTARPMASLDQAELVYRKATALLGQNLANDAIDALRSALALDSAHANARQLLARLLLEHHQEAAGVALLEDGMGRHPEQIQWALYLARIQLERGNAERALETLQRGREPASGSHEYRGFLAAMLQRLEQHAAAIERYRQALALAPAEGRYWVGLGISQEATGQAAAATESYRRARGATNLPPDLIAFLDRKGY